MVRRGQAACGGESTFFRRIGSRWEALFVAYRGDAKNAVRALATSAGSVMVRAHLPVGRRGLPLSVRGSVRHARQSGSTPRESWSHAQ